MSRHILLPPPESTSSASLDPIIQQQQQQQQQYPQSSCAEGGRQHSHNRSMTFDESFPQGSTIDNHHNQNSQPQILTGLPLHKHSTTLSSNIYAAHDLVQSAMLNQQTAVHGGVVDTSYYDISEYKIDRVFQAANVFRLTESPIQSSNSNILPAISIDDLNDGDRINFAGRHFRYINLSDPNKKFPAKKSSSETRVEEESKKNHLEVFLDDIPFIVSDQLLEPISDDFIASIF
jgi:hypothetical protein